MNSLNPKEGWEGQKKPQKSNKGQKADIQTMPTSVQYNWFESTFSSKKYIFSLICFSNIVQKSKVKFGVTHPPTCVTHWTKSKANFTNLSEDVSESMYKTKMKIIDKPNRRNLWHFIIFVPNSFFWSSDQLKKGHYKAKHNFLPPPTWSTKTYFTRVMSTIWIIILKILLKISSCICFPLQVPKCEIFDLFDSCYF